MALDETQLAIKAKEGDADAFGALYDAYIRKIHDFTYYRTHHKETAEDLTSKTFLKAWDGITSYEPKKGAFSAWLYRIARNTIVDHYRSMKTTIDIEDVWDTLADGTDVAHDADIRERLAEVSVAIRTLSSLQRDIVVMRLWDGLSHAEIASVLGKNEGAIKMTYSRAMTELRKNVPLAAILMILTNPFA